MSDNQINLLSDLYYVVYSFFFHFSFQKAVRSNHRPTHKILSQIKEKSLHSGKDNEFNAFILDEDSEDRLLDEMEDLW